MVNGSSTTCHGVPSSIWLGYSPCLLQINPINWISNTFLYVSLTCLHLPSACFHFPSGLYPPTLPPTLSSSPVSAFMSNSALMDTSFAQKVPRCLSGRQQRFSSLQSPACPGPSEPRGHRPPVMTRCGLALEVCANREQVGNLGYWAYHAPW